MPKLNPAGQEKLTSFLREIKGHIKLSYEEQALNTFLNEVGKNVVDLAREFSEMSLEEQQNILKTSETLMPKLEEVGQGRLQTFLEEIQLPRYRSSSHSMELESKRKLKITGHKAPLHKSVRDQRRDGFTSRSPLSLLVAMSDPSPTKKALQK